MRVGVFIQSSLLLGGLTNKLQSCPNYPFVVRVALRLLGWWECPFPSGTLRYQPVLSQCPYYYYYYYHYYYDYYDIIIIIIIILIIIIVITINIVNKLK